MKKIITAILIVILVISNLVVYGAVDPSIPVPELRGESIDLTNMTSYDAYDKGVELLNNSVFTDISNSSYKREITRMAAQGIITRRDGGEFSPTVYISRGDALRFLVRLIGGEEAVNQTVLTNSQGMDSNAIKSLYQDEYANSAVNSGILTQEEIGNLSEPATKEDIAIWLSRSLGLQPDYKDQNILLTFKDWEKVVPENRSIIETLIGENIIEVDNDGNFKPDRYVTRGEMSYILDKASPYTFDQRNMSSNTGIVVGYNTNTVIENGESINLTPIIVKNLDGTTTTINVKLNNDSNKKNEFVSYENGVASDSRIINIGDEIQYIIMNDQVIFVEIFGDNTVLEKMRQIEKDDSDTKTYFGTINKVISEKIYKGKGYSEITRARINNYDGSVFDVIVDYDAVNNIKNDIAVFKGGIYGGINLLEVGDVVEYKVRNNEFLEYMNVSDIREENVMGTVRNINISENGELDSITVYDYDNKILEYYVPRYATIDINSKYGQLKDLQFGQEVELDVKDGIVLVIKSETFVENPGYIPEYGKQRIGTLSKVYSDRVSVVLANGDVETYNVNNNTVIQKDNTTFESKVLRDGDKVKLYFNDIYTDSIAKIVIEGKEQLITNVYTGIIDDVDKFNRKIFLREPYELDNTQWNEVDEYRKELIFDNDSEVYFMNDQIDLDRLNNEYRNEVIYVAVIDSYGKEKVAKLNVQSGGERTFEDEIKVVNSRLGEFELENKNNVTYDKGTIVVKQNRLVDPSSIMNKRTAFIVAGHFSGNNNANIVRLFGETNEIFKNIHIGTVEELDIRSVEMANHSKMRYNEFDEVDDDNLKKFYYYNDTLIKDVTDPRKEKEISPYKFFHGGYTREENKDEDNKGLNYERYYAVFYTNDSGGIEAMNIRKEGLLRNYNIDDEVSSSKDMVKELNSILKKSVVTKGKIVEIDDKWKRIKLTDTQDWVKSTGEWSSNRNDMYVDVADAVIIRNERPYDYDNLREGQRVYISRYKEDAIAIIIQ